MTLCYNATGTNVHNFANLHYLLMSVTLTTLFPPGASPTFSGHEIFALRSNWLKKAYDILRYTPDLFYRPDAFVLLGVGASWPSIALMAYRSNSCSRSCRRPANWLPSRPTCGRIISPSGKV